MRTSMPDVVRSSATETATKHHILPGRLWIDRGRQPHVRPRDHRIPWRRCGQERAIHQRRGQEDLQSKFSLTTHTRTEDQLPQQSRASPPLQPCSRPAVATAYHHQKHCFSNKLQNNLSDRLSRLDQRSLSRTTLIVNRSLLRQPEKS